MGLFIARAIVEVHNGRKINSTAAQRSGSDFLSSKRRF
jgi:signal transduction histidine kinase